MIADSVLPTLAPSAWRTEYRTTASGRVLVAGSTLSSRQMSAIGDRYRLRALPWRGGSR